MPTFTVGQDIVTNENENVVTVDVDPANPLPKGLHTFQLRVVDDDDLTSDPITVDVVVRDDRRPTAVVRAPATVPFGESFLLDGRESSDLPPGRVVRYIWTMLR
jgi:hypothetical protein